MPPQDLECLNEDNALGELTKESVALFLQARSPFQSNAPHAT